MSIAVTGASGHLGRLVVEQLLAKGDKAIAIARTPDRVNDLAAKGAEVRQGDYEDPASLDKAFAGVDKVLLVSGSELGRRFAQHKNAIDAAKKAGVKLLVYTSVANAGTIATTKLASEHQETEKYLRASGVPFSILRNSWYIENYTEQLPTTLKLGSLFAGAGTAPCRWRRARTTRRRRSRSSRRRATRARRTSSAASHSRWRSSRRSSRRGRASPSRTCRSPSSSSRARS